ncbi:MAG: tRNA (N6-threonylcarbamoyladenosine(37)-N6)-methyltransferase TrmO [Lachnospiraceae bacterium]|nr:tRNA (N6-threonylcarbamoyladenosine(37)-N6)-methyltransferase TrmO [Lachnospiraceae bacterium]
MTEITMQRIATIHTDLPEKFGIPRQSQLVPELTAKITFEEAYRNPESVRGLSDFDYIWLLWVFETGDRSFHATVRPPRLGGNTRMGVFATRSPFRPNPIGLSCVRLLKVEQTEQGPMLTVSGADLKDGTAILDIKPYLPYADAYPNARGGFTQDPKAARPLLQVEIAEKLLQNIPEDKREALKGILAQDPRPAYIEDDEREYGMMFAGKNVRFSVSGDRLLVSNIT